jgi:hypothetical protein
MIPYKTYFKIILPLLPEILNCIHAFKGVNKIRVNKTISIISIKYKYVQFWRASLKELLLFHSKLYILIVNKHKIIKKNKVKEKLFLCWIKQHSTNVDVALCLIKHCSMEVQFYVFWNCTGYKWLVSIPPQPHWT